MRTTALIAILLLASSSHAATPIGKELQDCLKLPEAELNLARAAFFICKEELPDLAVEKELAKLNALSEKLFAMLNKAGTVQAKLDALKTLLFDEEQYAIPTKDDVSDFLLSEVMKNKRGNCLGLSVLCLALAERTGLKLHGVPVPSRLSGAGHLLVRFDDGTARQNFDPTQKGAAQKDEYYKELFKLRDADMKDGYILGNATKRDVVCLLLINLAAARIDSGKPQTALGLLEAAVAMKPAYAPAHNNLGAARLRMGDYGGAAAAYNKALTLQPGFSAPLLGLAEIAMRRGQLDDAMNQAKTVLKDDPGSIEARHLMASIHVSRNEWRLAAELLKEALQSSPKDVRALCNLGKVYIIGGDFLQAESTYREAIAADDKSADAQYGLGMVLRATGNMDGADDAFAAALKIDPEHIPTILGDAQQAQVAQKFDIAAAGYEKVLKKDPYHADALNGLVKMLMIQKKPNDALKRLADVVKAQPENYGAAALLADTLSLVGDHAGALRLLEARVTKVSGAEKIPMLQRIGIFNGKLKLHKKAYDAAEEILKLDPKDMVALRLAAAACEGLQNRDKAVSFYKKILEIEADDQNARQALMRLGAK